MKFNIDLQNCYGIGALQKEIEFKGKSGNTAIIYAPNGTMKTSLRNVFLDIENNRPSSDIFYPERNTIRSVTFDGKELTKDDLYVFRNEDADGKKSVSTFLANPELKAQYDSILQELVAAKTILLKKAKKISGSSNLESEILETFKRNGNGSFYECLSLLESCFPKDGAKLPVFTFKFNDVFDKGNNVQAFLEENRQIIGQYFTQYTKLITTSGFFTGGTESFGTYQAQNLLNSVGDGRFFGASHQILLKDKVEIKSKEGLKSKIDEEVNRIFNNDELKSIYGKLESKLSKNKAMTSFKEVIQREPGLIQFLIDYDAFKKMVLASYMQQCLEEFTSLHELYKSKKAQLQAIIQQANQDIAKWQKVINLFNARFFVPFTVSIDNVSDVLLNDQTASLHFTYKDCDAAAPIEPDTNSMVKELSTGEQKAFNILQNIFVLEGLKADNRNSLIVMDDIADSFDYKNKYAIIEYLSDLSHNDNFHLLILTHNFDFYRTIVSRLNVNLHFFAHKHADRTIELCQGLHNSDILKRKVINQALKNDRAFVCLIPFVRNMIEYSKGTSDPSYMTLTSCLHIKDDTDSITKGQIFDIFKDVLPVSFKEASIGDHSVKYIDMLDSAVQNAIDDDNEVEITNKLAISIAIRLVAERFMFSALTKEQLNKVALNDKQTMQLADKFKEYHGDTHPAEALIMNKVLMLTSENIHFNNFMFEPLVDMSILHLKRLYDEVSQLKWE